METQFTPAPLFVVDYSDIKDGSRIGTLDILTKDRFEPSAKWIAQVMPYGASRGNFPEHDEAKAYAQLFASAPDMFSVIKELYEYTLKNGTRVYNQGALEAAYLKATGQQITPIENQ